MADPTIIRVGTNGSSEYVAFGDDCQLYDLLVFAFAIVRRTDVSWVEKRIAALKLYFGLPSDLIIHCRVLLHPHQREKAGISHLSTADARKIISRMITIANQASILIRYTWCRAFTIQEAVGTQIELKHVSDGTTITHPVNPDPKVLLSILMQTCFAVPPDGSEGPLAAECEIIVAKEPTKKHQFIGKGKRRIDRMYSVYSDIGAERNEIFDICSTPKPQDCTSLLQLADVAAYVCAHARDSDDQQEFYKQQYRRIRHYIEKEWCFDEPPPEIFPPPVRSRD